MLKRTKQWCNNNGSATRFTTIAATIRRTPIWQEKHQYKYGDSNNENKWGVTKTATAIIEMEVETIINISYIYNILNIILYILFIYILFTYKYICCIYLYIYI